MGAWPDQAGSPQRYGTGRCGWSWSTRISTSHRGRRYLDRGEDRLYGGDVAQLGAAGRAGCGPATRADDGGTGPAQAARTREFRAAAGERDPAEGVGIFRPGGARPPSEMMVSCIDAHRAAYGVEPICAGLPIAPALYYELKAREREPARQPARPGRGGTRPWASTLGGCGARTGKSTGCARSGSNCSAKGTLSPAAR